MPKGFEEEALHAEPGWFASADALPLPRKRSLCEPLDLTNISLQHPCGHQPGKIVQSIHHLLCSNSTGSARLRPWSCELPRQLDTLSLGSASLPPHPSRHSLGSVSSQGSLFRQPIGQGIPMQSDQMSRRSSGSLSAFCGPSLPDAPSLGCPAVPGLVWKSMIGCGSFASVYKGEYHGREVAVKVMSSRRCEAAFSGDLFESLVSANMHHPNVVETFEVLTVQQSAEQCQAPLSSSKITSTSNLPGTRLVSLEASAPSGQAPDVDNVVDFLNSYHIEEQPCQNTALSASNPQGPFGPRPSTATCSVFAPSAGEAGCAKRNVLIRHSSQPRGATELDGTLLRDGAFQAARTVSSPLPLSPFDAAVTRAEGEAGSGDGCKTSAAAGALMGIKRHSSDGAAWPSAEHGLRRSCGGDAHRSTSGREMDASESWPGSSGGTDNGGPASARSPLPEPPQPQPPRSTQVLLLMELGDQRSLHTAISKGRFSGDMVAILLCAMDVADGMAYLHSLGLVHSDLKPANVLLMSAPVTPEDPRGFTCKIADFGMARLLSKGASHAETDTLGTLPYVAPEVLQRGEVGRPADVYSFAVLLLEMWCGRVAYLGENVHGVLYSAFYGRRPRVPADTPAAFRALIESCWAADAEQRPSFEAARAQLAAMLAIERQLPSDLAISSSGME